MGRTGARAGRPLSRSTLAAAADLVAAKPEQLSPLETEFVAASNDAAQADDRRRRRNARRLRTLTVGLAITLVGALIAGAIAVAQRNESTAQRNRAREQTALAEGREKPLATRRSARWPRRPARLRTRTIRRRCCSRSRPIACDPTSTPSGRSRSHCWGDRTSPVRCSPVCSSCTSSRLPDGKTISGGTTDGRIVQIDAGDRPDARRVEGLGRRTRRRRPQRRRRRGRGSLGVGKLLVRDPDGSVRTLAEMAFSRRSSPSSSSVARDAGPGLAVATSSGVRIVDIASGETLRTFAGYAAGWLSESGDGKRLAIESNAAPWTVTTIDIDSGDPVGPVVRLEWPAGIALNRAGDRLGSRRHPWRRCPAGRRRYGQ